MDKNKIFNNTILKFLNFIDNKLLMIIYIKEY